MPTYLENLTLRLAAGVGRLPESLRMRHADYLKSAQRADGGFAGREGASDLYYTSFALRSLALLGELDGEPAERAAAFLKGRMTGQAPIIDFVSLLYGAALLDSAAGIDLFSEAPPAWRGNLATLFEQFRRPDGRYAKTEEGQSRSSSSTARRPGRSDSRPSSVRGSARTAASSRSARCARAARTRPPRRPACSRFWARSMTKRAKRRA